MKQHNIRHLGRLAALLFANHVCCLRWSTGRHRFVESCGFNETPRGANNKIFGKRVFINMAAGAEAHHLANNEQYELFINGIKNESDLVQQVNLVEQMMATGVNIIVLAPADSKGLLPVVKARLRRVSLL